MRKVIAFAVLVCLFSTALAVPCVTFAEPTVVPDLTTKIFELDLTDPSNVVGNKAVVKATAETASNLNSSEAISLDPRNAAQKNGNPTYAEHTINGRTTPYLRFAYSTDGGTTFTNPGSRIMIPMKSELNIPEEEALSFEMWVKSDYITTSTASLPGDVVSFGRKTTSGESMYSAITLKIRKDWGLCCWPAPPANYGGAEVLSFGSIEDKNAKWIHVVTTRVWNKVSDAAGSTPEKGYWASSLYLNGNLVETKFRGSEASPLNKPDYDDEDGTKPWSYLFLGGTNNSNDGFHGDIAAFTLWKGEMLANQALNQYLDTRKNFVSVVDVAPIANIDAGSTSLEISFTGDIEDTTVTDKNIYIKNSDGDRLKSTVVYDADENTATFTIGDHIGYAEELTLCIDGVLDSTGGPIGSKTVKFYSNPGELGKTIISYGNGTGISDADKVEASMNFTDASAEKKYAIAIVVFDDDNRIIELDIKTSTEPGTVKASTSKVLGSGYTVKALAWVYDTERGLRVISDALVLER